MRRYLFLLVFVGGWLLGETPAVAQLRPAIRWRYPGHITSSLVTVKPVTIGLVSPYRLTSVSSHVKLNLPATGFSSNGKSAIWSQAARGAFEGRPPVERTQPSYTFLALQRVAFVAQREALRKRFPGKDKIDAVIFDMDGTLLDSIPAWDHAATKYLQTRGIDLPEEIQNHVKHLSLLEGARYIKEQLNLPDEPEVLLAGTLDIVRGRYLYEVPAKPGAEEVLKTLHAQGIKICVATASDPELAFGAFERLGLLQYIDFVIGCDEVGVGKQSPAVYEAALRRLGTARERTLVVEDALYAVETAKAAGFPTAGVPDPVYSAPLIEILQSTADYFFSSLENSLK